MYPTAPFHTFFLLAFTILFLACSSVVTGTAEDFQIAEGEVLPSGFEYTPLHMTGTIGEIALNHTGTIEEILARVTTEIRASRSRILSLSVGLQLTLSTT
tara:strand:+ start:803 stop:1102 length:300 start_codon:yes stop_codon:yes gene_type:complete